jgi:hypothetical protein
MGPLIQQVNEKFQNGTATFAKYHQNSDVWMFNWRRDATKKQMKWKLVRSSQSGAWIGSAAGVGHGWPQAAFRHQTPQEFRV